jgi:hypothetical protein
MRLSENACAILPKRISVFLYHYIFATWQEIKLKFDSLPDESCTKIHIEKHARRQNCNSVSEQKSFIFALARVNN